ncbi:MATE family efflux transporter [Novosphingobium sp. PhB55]|uniref:MATE family efflux transporter n=1 Tax=Novosphingobium sp. PhB55 TaxID=2485106 RepID=UPI001FB9BDFB|nr:MATE family efflux transporter [Novosphingobium sp. PhB55]
MKGDLTQGPILKTLMVFSVPMLISNVLQTLNGSVNAIWVGRLLGEAALAATANANVIMFLLFALVFGFGMATTVRVGQHFGARDIDAARRTFGSGLGFCLVLSGLCGIGGWFGADALLHSLGTPEASRVEALAYLRVIFVTIPLGSMSMMVSMGMRGAGDSKTPLYAMILTVALDIVLNPLLIIGPGPIPTLGIAGSAMATAFANFAGLVYQLWRIYRQDLPMRLRGPELGYLVPRGPELAYVIVKGLPMGAQMLLVSSAGLIMVSLVNREGLDAAAAYGASLQLWNYLQMPAFAIGSAVSAMVAQSLGAGDHGRVGKVTEVGLVTNLALSTLVAALIVLLDRPLLALFLGGDSPAMPIARHIQLVCTASFVIVSITMILTGTMRAYGAVVAPLVIMFLGLYPGRLGFYWLAYPVIGSDAVWWSYPVGSALTVALTIGYYRWGKWRAAFKA